MALRDQLLGLGDSVYNRIGQSSPFNFPMGGPGPVSSFDPFTNREGPSPQASNPLAASLPAFMSPSASAPVPAPTPTGAAPTPTASTSPVDSPLRGLASIPQDIRAQLTRADLQDLPVNLLTGELSATPQTDMGFITVNPQGPHSGAAYHLPLNFQPPQFEQVSGGESPAWRNLTTGEIGPLPDPNFDPGLGNFTSTSRNDFLQGGGGSTFDLLPAGKFGNPDTAFMSPQGFWDWSSSPFSMFGSLLGGALGIAGLPASGFISPIAQALGGFGGLLAQDLSGSSAVGLGTKEGIGLLGLHL